jgi:membrane fusion protein (multidrug efflux system)
MNDQTQIDRSAANENLRGLRRARLRRRVLMLVVPLLVVIGGLWFYMSGGRYVSTDNAYVKADKTVLSADVSGRVVEIAVKDNQRVQRGDLLFRLDDRPHRLAVDQAKAKAAEARLQIEQLRAKLRQNQAELRSAQDKAAWQDSQVRRYTDLAARGVFPQEKMEQIRVDLQSAQQAVAVAQQQIASTLASLGGQPNLPSEQHPLVMQADAAVRQAELDLSHTVITAPADGTVSRVGSLHAGEFLAAGMPAFSLVSSTVWIEANFKETDLTFMRPGNTVTVAIDTYPDHDLKGTVASISPGTGAEFSLLPAQNATGNWVKVTQRIPVRIELEGPQAPIALRAGMSTTVEVDTGHRRQMLAFIQQAIAGER